MRLEKGELRIEDWEFKFEDGGLRIKEGNIKIWGFHHAISTINTHISGHTLSRLTIFYGHSKSQNFLLENNWQLFSGLVSGEHLFRRHLSWPKIVGPKLILDKFYPGCKMYFDQSFLGSTCFWPKSSNWNLSILQQSIFNMDIFWLKLPQKFGRSGSNLWPKFKFSRYSCFPKIPF